MCDKEQRKVFSKEVPALLRNQKNYKEQLDIVEESSEVDLQKTKGVKRYCELNNLSYFDIFENPTVETHMICRKVAFAYLCPSFLNFVLTIILSLEKS